MTLEQEVYEYILNNYEENEPVFLSDLAIDGVRNVSLRQQLKKLVEEGRIRRYDTGIYYIPGKSSFRSGGTLSLNDVLRKKYLTDGEKRCGYVGGILFANQLGLTTQLPSSYEVSTNKATTAYRETELASVRIILRKPVCAIDEDNWFILQFMDLLKEIDEISEVEGSELVDKITVYTKSRGIVFGMIKPYLRYYPDRIYRNMYETGVLNGFSA